MGKLTEELDYAYRLVSSVPVTGDAIDMIAEARARMRNVFDELKKMEEAEEKTDA
jgi:hypothetical protein